MFKGSNEIQSYAFWHGKLRLHILKKLLDGSHNLESYVDDVLGHTENWSKKRFYKIFLKG